MFYKIDKRYLFLRQYGLRWWLDVGGCGCGSDAAVDSDAMVMVMVAMVVVRDVVVVAVWQVVQHKRVVVYGTKTLQLRLQGWELVEESVDFAVWTVWNTTVNVTTLSLFASFFTAFIKLRRIIKMSHDQPSMFTIEYLMRSSDGFGGGTGLGGRVFTVPGTCNKSVI